MILMNTEDEVLLQVLTSVYEYVTWWLVADSTEGLKMPPAAGTPSM